MKSMNVGGGTSSGAKEMIMKDEMSGVAGNPGKTGKFMNVNWMVREWLKLKHRLHADWAEIM